MRRILRAPALHFLVSGALLLAADRFLIARASPAEPTRAPIEIGAERIEALRAEWVARNGVIPDARVLDALVAAEIDDAVLLAEARARGLEREDPVVRVRLARNLGFLDATDDPGRAGAGDAVDEALRVGLARGDLVVRRRLLERMRGALVHGGQSTPSEDEIAARFANEAPRGASPARVRLSHVFLSRDRHGATLDADADRLRVRVLSESLDFARAIALGDPFLLGHDLPPRAEADLAREFGADFARAAFALEPGVISTPIASSFGVHLVVVHEHRPGVPATLDARRAEIAAELARERDAAALAQALDDLRSRYEVRVARVEP